MAVPRTPWARPEIHGAQQIVPPASIGAPTAPQQSSSSSSSTTTTTAAAALAAAAAAAGLALPLGCRPYKTGIKTQ